jgi:hypothetical protein
MTTHHPISEVVRYILNHDASYSFLIERVGEGFTIPEKVNRDSAWREVK